MWKYGNAEDDGAWDGGWFLGYFQEGREPALTSRDIEIKWSQHPPGDERSQWAPGNGSTSICILVSGDMTLLFQDGRADLRSPGDYVLWGPGTPHSWRSAGDTTVITMRWPSGP